MGLKLLHVLGTLDQRDGGPVRAVLDLCSRALLLGQESDILSFGKLLVDDNPFPLSHIHMLALPQANSYAHTPALRPWLREHLGEYRGVVLHGMWLYPQWATASECRRAGVPYACFPHGMLDRWPIEGQGLAKRLKKTAYWYLRERDIFRKARQIFFTTEREWKNATATFRLPERHRILVPFGLAPASEEPRIQAAKQSFPGRRLALFLGRLHPKKNVHFLISAWAEARLGPEWLLVVAGAGAPGYEAELRSLVECRELQGSVLFVGHVSGTEKTDLLRSAEWFLLPSEQENFGVAVLEAIQHGCTVAVSDQVYLADHFHRQSEVIPLTKRAWVEFLRTRMPDSSWRQTILERDRQVILPRFEIGKVARDWTDELDLAFRSN